MQEEKTLNLILDKLGKIERLEEKMDRVFSKLQEAEVERREMKQEMKSMKQEMRERFIKLETGQEMIKEYIANSEEEFKKIDDAYKFIEGLKKVVTG
ncbi:MAG: hypothetical protein PWQ96_1980 [Clostridia bacterium]|jgi:predicted unusual protein kinase regulating ubiquinone biosynthesis (AarF/ABC1/UbiB family)|nr:hypothetical protein [Clostridiales bacterium]MDK2986336.1 hypothetical protein [Clostridia bacterium]